MKVTKSELKEVVLEILNEESSEYQEFFRSALEKFGVSSPDELDDAKKKEFFDYVDANWDAKEEGDVDEACKDDELDEELEPVSQAAGEPEYNPTKRLKAKKRDQILAGESKIPANVIGLIKKMVKEELTFLNYSDVADAEPVGGRKVQKRRKRLGTGV